MQAILFPKKRSSDEERPPGPGGGEDVFFASGAIFSKEEFHCPSEAQARPELPTRRLFAAQPLPQLHANSSWPIPFSCGGFQSPIKDMDREKFGYALNRDSFLTGMNWKMLHFSFDEIRTRPDVCRMLLQLSVGPLLFDSRKNAPTLTPEEKEVLRFAWRLGRPIRPKDLKDTYRFGHRKANMLLRSLVDRQLLCSASEGKYACRYETVGHFPEQLL